MLCDPVYISFFFTDFTLDDKGIGRSSSKEQDTSGSGSESNRKKLSG